MSSFSGASTMFNVHPLPGLRSRPGSEVVIALHCSASNGRQWDAYPQLLPPGMRLMAPDLMGYGSGENWPSGKAVSLDAEARRLAPLLSEAPGGVHLVGHSYGGAVALQVALRWPSRVRTLTLFEPVRFGLLLADRDQEVLGQAILSVGRCIGWHAMSDRLEQAAALFVDYWSGSGAWEALPASRRRAIAERMHKVHAEFAELFADRVPASAYGKVEMHLLLITGSTSPLPARKVADLIARQCPQAELVRLNGVGHMGPVSHPSAVASLLAFQPRQAQMAEAA
jgi:pimeloyl-ACP methyl ester carboxylesterase